MLLNGTNLDGQGALESQACLTVSQLVLFNTKSSKSAKGACQRYSIKMEPPLPLYVGLNVHTSTTSKWTICIDLVSVFLIVE